MYAEGRLCAHAWEIPQPLVAEQVSTQSEAVRQVLKSNPALEAEELDAGWREMLRALQRDGAISEEVFEELTAEVDAQLAEGFRSLEAADAKAA